MIQCTTKESKGLGSNILPPNPSPYEGQRGSGPTVVETKQNYQLVKPASASLTPFAGQNSHDRVRYPVFKTSHPNPLKWTGKQVISTYFHEIFFALLRA